jgi:hypothetical protein
VIRRGKTQAGIANRVPQFLEHAQCPEAAQVMQQNPICVQQRHVATKLGDHMCIPGFIKKRSRASHPALT